MRTLPLCAAAAFLFLLSGCGEETSYMPLELGSQWSYTLYDSAELPTQIEVMKPVRIGKDLGWELRSPHLGPLTLGWQDGALKTSLLSGTTFDPPLPMLVPKAGFLAPGKEASSSAPDQRRLGQVSWSGRMMVAGEWRSATARLTQTLLEKKDPDKKLARSEAEGCRVRMVLEWEGEAREVITSFVKGRGIIRQTSKTVGKEGSISLIYLGGPLKGAQRGPELTKEAAREAPQDDPSNQGEPQSTPQEQPEILPDDPATAPSPT